MPVGPRRSIACVNGAVFALWPVMWIVFNAMLLYNIAVASGRFDAFRRWTIEHLPNDRRIVLVAIGFCFGALLEGVAGFGTPVAITSSLLILVGFPPLEALVFVLIFNTAPVAFGALGAPVTVLGAVTGLPAVDARRDDRPATAVHGADPAVLRDVRLWRHALGQGAVAGAAGRRRQLRASASSSPRTTSTIRLTDVLASLGSLLATLWLPQAVASGARPGIRDPARRRDDRGRHRGVPSLAGLAAVAHRRRRVVIAWTSFKIFAIGQQRIPWPGLDKAISITLYNDKPYAAIWTFQPLATGTGILRRRDHHARWPCGVGAGRLLRLRRAAPSARSGSRSSPSASSSASPI